MGMSGLAWLLAGPRGLGVSSDKEMMGCVWRMVGAGTGSRSSALAPCSFLWTFQQRSTLIPARGSETSFGWCSPQAWGSLLMVRMGPCPAGVLHLQGAAVLPTPGLGRRDNVIRSSLAQKRLRIPSQWAGGEASWGKSPGGAHSQISQLGIGGEGSGSAPRRACSFIPFPQGTGREKESLASKNPWDFVLQTSWLGMSSGGCPGRTCGK